MNGLRYWLPLVCALPLLGAAHAETPTQLVDPRPGSHVLDGAGLLKPQTRAAVDTLVRDLLAHGEAELMVVTVRSADGMDPRRHATAVFNHLAIGRAPTQRGVLLWVAPTERAAELVLGDGIDTTANRSTAANIMQYQIVPAFRAGDPDAGVLAGSKAVAHQLLGLPTAEAAPGTVGAAELPPPEMLVTPVPETIGGTDARPDEATSGSAPAGPHLATPPAAAATEESLIPTWLAGGGIGAVLLGGLAWLRRWLRYRPRPCRTCRSPMLRLSEADDDIHLDSGERAEERVRSVDYDVWLCRACGAVDKLRYGAWFTSYAKCPQCRARTKSSTSTTLVAATYDHGGRVRVDERCAHCSFRHSSEHATARKTRSSSSSSSRGFGGGGGGGRSSGGGASGRW